MKVYINHKGELWADYKFLKTHWSSPIGGVEAVPLSKDAYQEAQKTNATLVNMKDWNGGVLPNYYDPNNEDLIINRYPGVRMDFLTTPLYGIRK